MIVREKREHANREQRMRWYRANREKCLAQMKAWREANHEKCLIKSKTWREKNRERLLADKKEWAKKNPEKRSESERIRRERIKGISPIGSILNERFDGSELHHTGVLESETGKSYGVYLPKSMNKGHCAQIGKERNLDRVNFDAIEFLVSEIDESQSHGLQP